MNLKRPPCWAILLLVLVTLGALRYRDETLGYKPSFTEFIFWRPFAAKNVEVKAYLLNEEQLKALAADPTSIAQGTQDTLYQKNLFLVMRIKCSTGCACWSTLLYHLPGKRGWFPIEVSPTSAMDFRQNRAFDYYVIPVGRLDVVNKPIPLPPIKTRWKAFYMKC